VSTRALSTVFFVWLASASAGCGGDASPPPQDAASDASTPPDAAADDAPVDAVTSAGTWRLTANIRVNGFTLQEGTRSAVATVDGTGTSVALTSVEGFCAARRAGQCPRDSNFMVTISVTGSAPGVYSIAAGQASVYQGDVTRDCRGGGIGADSGTVTLSRVDQTPGGSVALAVDVTFPFGGRLTGTVEAPVCNVP
jgi:hypothetical protein